MSLGSAYTKRTEENESPHIIATSIPSGNYTQDRVLDDLEPLEKSKLEKGHEISMVVIWMKHRTHLGTMRKIRVRYCHSVTSAATAVT